MSVDETSQHRIKKLLDSIEGFLDEKHIPDAQKGQIARRLGETIGLEVLLQVGDSLTPTDGEAFVSAFTRALAGDTGGPAVLQSFVVEKFSEEARFKILSKAVENVLQEFRGRLES